MRIFQLIASILGASLLITFSPSISGYLASFSIGGHPEVPGGGQPVEPPPPPGEGPPQDFNSPPPPAGGSPPPVAPPPSFVSPPPVAPPPSIVNPPPPVTPPPSLVNPPPPPPAGGSPPPSLGNPPPPPVAAPVAPPPTSSSTQPPIALPTDITPPSLNGEPQIIVDGTSVMVTIMTSESVSSEIRVGPASVFNFKFGQTQSASFSNLPLNTVLPGIIIIKDAAGNMTQTAFTVTTGVTTVSSPVAPEPSSIGGKIVSSFRNVFQFLFGWIKR